MIVDKTDFKGKYAVALNKFDNLQDYIDRYEEPLINQLFGKDLAQDFISDINDPKWDDVKGIGFGLTSLLVGLIFFEYVRDLPYRVVNKGVVYQLDENASQVIAVSILVQRYNECVSDWNRMARQLRHDFPEEYSGKRLKYMTE